MKGGGQGRGARLPAPGVHRTHRPLVNERRQLNVPDCNEKLSNFLFNNFFFKCSIALSVDGKEKPTRKK